MDASQVTGTIMFFVFLFSLGYLMFWIYHFFLNIMVKQFNSSTKSTKKYSNDWDEPVNATYIILPNGERRLD
jgi:hypothetical protein